MTVAELIEKLKEVDPNLSVHVGVFVAAEYGLEYEFGILDKIETERGLVYLNSAKQWP